MTASPCHTVVVCRGVSLQHCIMATVTFITCDVCPAQEVKVSVRSQLSTVLGVTMVSGQLHPS
jgi:hypothetical protein